MCPYCVTSPKFPSPFQIRVKVDIKTRDQNKGRNKMLILLTFCYLPIDQSTEQKREAPRRVPRFYKQSTHLKIGFRGESTFIRSCHQKLVEFFILWGKPLVDISDVLATFLESILCPHHKVMNMLLVVEFKITRNHFDFLGQFQYLAQSFAKVDDK